MAKRNGLRRKKKKNKKKKKRRNVSTNHDWSKLCPDILRKIFETLRSPIDSHRAKTVCSDWYSVWKTCVNKPPCPWRIIHQGDSPTVKKDTRNLTGLSHRSHCMASYGNCLLMVDRYLKFYILNFLTKEKISLPSMELPIRGIEKVRFRSKEENYSNHGYLVGRYRKDRVSYEYNDVEWKNSLAVLWINETTGHYVVAWSFIQHYLFSLKKGDDCWCNLNHKGKSLVLFDMACENGKLYLFTADHQIKIYNFSEVSSKKFLFSPFDFVEQPLEFLYPPFDFVEQPWEFVWKKKIAIRKSGEVLIILSLKQVKYEETLMFYIFKMNLESDKWERVYSIGDEMLSFGHGVTVALVIKILVMESSVIQSISLMMTFGQIIKIMNIVLQIVVSSILPQVKSNGLRKSIVPLIKLNGLFPELLIRLCIS